MYIVCNKIIFESHLALLLLLLFYVQCNIIMKKINMYFDRISQSIHSNNDK